MVTTSRRAKPKTSALEPKAEVPAQSLRLRVLHVASEASPFIKSGGLADVALALPASLRRLGHDARLAIPCYRSAYLEADRRKTRWLPTPMVIEAGGVDHRVGIGVCDVDGALLYHRDDDKEEVILGRLEVYKAQTAPLIEFYTERDKLTAVDGEQPIDKILKDILETVKS